MKKVGVLALQGDFESHQKALQRLGADVVQVRTPADLSQVGGLVIPGGESTTILRLLRTSGLFEEIKSFAQTKPIFGTCAGSILLANEVKNPQQDSLDVMDIGVVRNGYGRQLDSCVTKISTELGGDMEAVFIRAPIIERVGKDARILATFKEDPVLVEQGHHMVATFHPELTEDTRVHERFLDKVQ